MAGKIFFSYRRGDDPGQAGRLFDFLQATFGVDQLFMDVDSIEPGLDFAKVIEERIAASDIFLAIIGGRWLTAADPNGARRLDNPADFVRLEIEEALSQDKRIIPVLVGDAHMPSGNDLPVSLAPLARRNAVRVTHERFRADAEGLTRALQRILESSKAAARRSQSDSKRAVSASARRKIAPWILWCIGVAAGALLLTSALHQLMPGLPSSKAPKAPLNALVPAPLQPTSSTEPCVVVGHGTTVSESFVANTEFCGMGGRDNARIIAVDQGRVQFRTQGASVSLPQSCYLQIACYAPWDDRVLITVESIKGDAATGMKAQLRLEPAPDAR